MKRLRLLIIFEFMFFVIINFLYGWGDWTHKRMTYWAWKHAKLPDSYGTVDVDVDVVWDLDTIENVLDMEATDMIGFIFFLIGIKKDFSTDTSKTISASMDDAALFTKWGTMPDSFDGEHQVIGGANVAHMYIPAGIGYADGCCKFFFDKAVKECNAGQRRRAYAYLAMAAHYLEDCGFPAHCEKNYLNITSDFWQMKHHGKCEAWLGDSTNWFKYFDAYCDSCSRYAIPVCDPVMAVHTMSWECIWDIQPFKDAWIDEAEYDWEDWDDDPLAWPAELKDYKPKTIALVKNFISRIQPRLVGLFLAFKNAKK